MFGNIQSKNYKFKINNVLITVDVDNSFSKVNHPYKADIMSYIRYQHYHMIHELFFIKDSPLSVFSSDKTVKYDNCAVCIPPKLNHLSFREKGYRILFAYTCDDKNTSNFAKFMKSLSDFPTPRKLETDEVIMVYMQELAKVLSSKTSVNDEIVVALLKLIFYKLYKLNTTNQNEIVHSSNQSYILKIDAMINQYQKDINLQTIADVLHLSTKQASRIIIKTYKKSLSVLLTEKRLNVACLLLRYTDYTISEIVEYINFPSESYFYQQFKKAYGCTPYKYKKMHLTQTN